MAKTIRQALRGRSDFISDIYVKDMLYAATVRCPYPHARILRIVTDSLDGKVVLVTAEDIPGPNSLDIGSESMPILARRECNYSGEPVALLAGES